MKAAIRFLAAGFLVVAVLAAEFAEANYTTGVNVRSTTAATDAYSGILRHFAT
jgi:uncharacterized protein YraI